MSILSMRHTTKYCN